MGNGLASFAVGLGTGYLSSRRQTALDEERQQDRAQRAEEQGLRMVELKNQKNLRLSLADAAQPVTVNEGAMSLDTGTGKPAVYEDAGVANSDYRQQRSMGLADVQAPTPTITAGGKAYASRPAADAAAAAANTPDAVASRQGAAYRAAGMPGEALGLEQKQASITAAQLKQAREYEAEGVSQAARALVNGDGAGMVKAFNSGGKFKIDGQPEITPEKRNIPGIGEIPTYNAKVRLVGADGKIVERTFNSHELMMQLMPYDKALELQRKGADTDSRIDQRTGQLELGAARLDAATARADASAAARNARTAGVPSREERLRYTSLFSEAGRRMNEAQNALGALSKDPLYRMAKPGSPQYQELQGIRDNVSSLSEERKMYQGMLANSQSNGPGLGDMRQPAAAPGAKAAPAAARAPVPASAKPDFSNLWAPK